MVQVRGRRLFVRFADHEKVGNVYIPVPGASAARGGNAAYRRADVIQIGDRCDMGPEGRYEPCGLAAGDEIVVCVYGQLSDALDLPEPLGRGHVVQLDDVAVRIGRSVASVGELQDGGSLMGAALADGSLELTREGLSVGDEAQMDAIERVRDSGGP